MKPRVRAVTIVVVVVSRAEQLLTGSRYYYIGAPGSSAPVQPPGPKGGHWAFGVEPGNPYNHCIPSIDVCYADPERFSVQQCRTVVKTSLLTECKCHGVSGSCTMKTCWKSLPPFRQIGDSLLKKYTKSREVVILQQQEVVRGKVKQSMKLVLKEVQFSPGEFNAEAPKKSDLVYLESSPNYCEKDVNSGSLGTVGRFCNRTSKGTSGCDLLCCGRGYNTHQYTKSWQCRCKFHWCCNVNCDTCVQKIEEYTCK